MGSPRQDPFLGWRVWRLRPEGLRSWAARCCWEPGINTAVCLSTNPCPRCPGSACRCGFWALFSLTHCLQHARVDLREQLTVVGLAQGWGEVSLHGEEGFRAAHAAVVALFTDWVWETGLEPASEAEPWWRRLLRAGEGPSRRRRTPPDSDRDRLLTTLARVHAVPLLSLADALESGFLGEVGVDAGRREEVRHLLQRGRPARGRSTKQGPGHHGVSDAA